MCVGRDAVSRGADANNSMTHHERCKVGCQQRIGAYSACSRTNYTAFNSRYLLAFEPTYKTCRRMRADGRFAVDDRLSEAAETSRRYGDWSIRCVAELHTVWHIILIVLYSVACNNVEYTVYDLVKMLVASVIIYYAPVTTS